MAQVDAFSKEVLAGNQDKRVVVVQSLVTGPPMPFGEKVVVYDRETAKFYRATAEGYELVGEAGPAGDDGRTILSGEVAPTTEGEDGDFYIDTVTDMLYGPKDAGSWPAGVSLVGPTGPAGPAGLAVPSSIWFPASVFSSLLGLSALDSSSRVAVWLFSPNGDESVSTSVMAPNPWVSFELDLYLKGVAPDAGDVRMLVFYDADPYTDGDGVGTPFGGAYTGVTVTSGGTGVIKVASNVLGTVPVSDNGPHLLIVRRDAGSALDTLNEDYGFVGVMLRGSVAE
jgi:hypothetical protein